MENLTDTSTSGYSNSTVFAEEYIGDEYLFEKVYKLILTIIGIFGNGGTIIILINRRNRKSSTAIYLTALAVSDILIIIFGPFCDWMELIFKDIMKNYGDFTCRLQTYMLYSSSTTSSWLLVAITVEKTICVMLPYRVRSSCTRKSTLITILSTWIVIYTADIHFLFGMGHTYNRLCDNVTRDSVKFTLYVLPWVDFSLCFAVPFLLISIGNVIIIRRMAISRRQRQFLTQYKLPKNTSVSPLIIAVNIVFIITVGPIHIFSIIFPHVKDSISPEAVESLLMFWGPMLNGLWEVNAAINMVLYIMSGSRFRKELKHLFMCKHQHDIFGVFDNSGICLNRLKRVSSKSAGTGDNLETLSGSNRGQRTSTLYD